MSESDPKMTSNRPYLLRALYDWILDNHLTPHILVDANAPDAVLPEELAADGRIVFNVAATAVRQFEIGNDAVRFHARFGGRPYAILVPVHAVLAIYARENGKGMAFPGDEPAADGGGQTALGAKPTLKLIK